MSKPTNQHQVQYPIKSQVSASRIATPDIQEDRVAKLPISKNLDTLEQTLNSLLTSISKYNPSISEAKKLVETNRDLESSINDIICHQRSGLEIDSLEEQSTLLDNDTKAILSGLNECRQKLRTLPSKSKALQELKDMEDHKVKADELLQYAMKLAKFTTAPPTFDSGSIGPNNFIWPAEDSLRRGMLALASMNADELVGKIPDGASELNGVNLDEEQRQNSSPKFQRRGSFGGSYGEDAHGNASDVIEDLDLFDPDDL